MNKSNQNTPNLQIEEINYDAILEKYPWLAQDNLKCIISPDADGLLCGLFMSYFLNWQIVGYYDNGKNLILKKGVKAKECIFLDTEIYRSDIRSVGHHISLLRQNNTEINLDNFRNCLNPNNLRQRTLKENFSLKYPMGTIHLLISIIGCLKNIKFSDRSFFAILQADGTINRFLDRYSENLRDWLLYFGAENSSHALNKMLNKKTTLLKINKEYVDYIQKFVKTKKDKIQISERGILRDLSFNARKTAFSKACVKSAEDYMDFLSKNTDWAFKKDKWTFDDFRLYEFTKKLEKPGVRNFNEAIRNNFLSLAITANDSMEYTLESPDKLP